MRDPSIKSIVRKYISQKNKNRLLKIKTYQGDTKMKQSNKFSGIIRFILFTVAILSLVKGSNSQNWVSQSSSKRIHSR